MHERERRQPTSTSECPATLSFSRERNSGFLHRGGEDVSHAERVGNIKSMLGKAQQHCEARNGKGTFDPITYLGETLTNGALSEGFSNTVRPEQSQSDAALRISRAFDALTLPYLNDKTAIDKEYKGIVTSLLRDGASANGRYVTLEPKGVQLLDAMVEALGIPHKRGEATIDILQNVPVAKARNANRIVTYVNRLLFPETEDGHPNVVPPHTQSSPSLLAALISAFTKDPTKSD